MELPKKLQKKLDIALTSNALRGLSLPLEAIDFSSNDYLGFSRSKHIFNQVDAYLQAEKIVQNGATGSRLLSGNHALYNIIEKELATFHNAEAALVFNSGYDANLGFFATIPQRGDLIFYDEFIHASIRDGIQMSNAKSYKFGHNDIADLQQKLERISGDGEAYVVTESVFSMDGDTPNLIALSHLCSQQQCHLIIEEAHAIGVYGEKGKGLIHELQLAEKVFARIITFGKALGCHGAAVLGSTLLKEYLVNFCRSFIYTTALSPHAIATVKVAYETLKNTDALLKLQDNIAYFNRQKQHYDLKDFFVPSTSSIHSYIISGNTAVKKCAKALQNLGFSVKPILSPTVPKGKERLRFCLHSYNTFEEIDAVLKQLSVVV